MTGILLVHGAWHGVLGQAFGEVQHHGERLASFRRKASSARRSWNGVGWVEYAHTFRSDNGYGGCDFLSDGRKARAADQSQIYFRLNQIGGHF